MTTQDELRWLIDTIITEWPTTGSLGDTHPPENVVLRHRGDGVNYYYEVGAGDPGVREDYDAVREQGAPLDGFRTVGVSEGAKTREFYGNKPQYDVTTTLDVRVEEKSVYENGTAESAAHHGTLVDYVQAAVNEAIVYPDVDPDADDIGRITYLDAAAGIDEDSLDSDNQDYFQTNFTVRLRGREDTPD